MKEHNKFKIYQNEQSRKLNVESLNDLMIIYFRHSPKNQYYNYIDIKNG